MKHHPLDIALLITIESILSFLIFILWLSKFCLSSSSFQLSFSQMILQLSEPFIKLSLNTNKKPFIMALPLIQKAFIEYKQKTFHRPFIGLSYGLSLVSTDRLAGSSAPFIWLSNGCKSCASLIVSLLKSRPKLAGFLRFQTIDKPSHIIATPSANTLYLSQPGTRSGLSTKNNANHRQADFSPNSVEWFTFLFWNYWFLWP